MIENERLDEEAEEIRRETADGAPEVAERDRVAELEKALDEANSKALYAAAEMQNVRRRLDLLYKDLHELHIYESDPWYVVELKLILQ